MLVKTAVLVTITTLAGSYSPALAGDSSVPGFYQDSVPFEHSRHPVLDGIPLKIGDLSVVTEMEADSIARSAPLDRATLERCIAAAPDFLQWSEDGATLEFKGVWHARAGAIDRVLTAFCVDGNVLLGGFEDPPGHGWHDVMFLKRATLSTPTKSSFNLHPFKVGTWPHETMYTLDEVRTIDPVSRTIVFAATSDNGDKALLAAPFAIVTEASARR
jgi:hypothetical protein